MRCSDPENLFATVASRPDQGNLNRTLAAFPGLTRTGERVRVRTTGRPAAVWSFPSGE